MECWFKNRLYFLVMLYHVIKLELGVIEADSQSQAEEKIDNIGFNVGYSSEKVVPDNDIYKDFWSNCTVETINEMRYNLSIAINLIVEISGCSKEEVYQWSKVKSMLDALKQK